MWNVFGFIRYSHGDVLCAPHLLYSDSRTCICWMSRRFCESSQLIDPSSGYYRRLRSAADTAVVSNDRSLLNRRNPEREEKHGSNVGNNVLAFQDVILRFLILQLKLFIES
ncbi:unnamed protein product [Sphacelaria rigidula]